MNLPIYLDNNATTRVDPRVLETMLPYFSNYYGNAASRTHAYGWMAEEAVAVARKQVAQLIGAQEQEMVFTSGATEAVNLAIKGVADRYTVKGNHIITTSIEHKAVLDACAAVEKQGLELTYLPVNEQGLPDLDQLEAAIRPTTILIACMYANNETGVVLPVQQIGTIAKRHEVLFFCDATQAVGKIPVNVVDDQIDLLALSAHKFYGPKGVGALYVRRRSPRVSLRPQIDGGGHERGMRSGTLNVPGIVGMGKAAAICLSEMDQDAARLEQLRNRLQEALLAINGTQLNGAAPKRLPHTLNLSFSNTDSNTLLLQFNKSLAISAGSACTSATLEPSYVLKAMGFSNQRAYSALRFGLGRSTTETEIDEVITLFNQTFKP